MEAFLLSRILRLNEWFLYLRNTVTELCNVRTNYDTFHALKLTPTICFSPFHFPALFIIIFVTFGDADVEKGAWFDDTAGKVRHFCYLLPVVLLGIDDQPLQSSQQPTDAIVYLCGPWTKIELSGGHHLAHPRSRWWWCCSPWCPAMISVGDGCWMILDHRWERLGIDDWRYPNTYDLQMGPMHLFRKKPCQSIYNQTVNVHIVTVHSSKTLNWVWGTPFKSLLKSNQINFWQIFWKI